MILPFSTQMNGNATYFVERIQRSISADLFTPRIVYKCDWFNPIAYFKVKPKHHTIREDKKDRWKAGNKIDFFINCRQKDMFRFAPVLAVVSIQKVEIKYLIRDAFGSTISIKIDGKEIDYSTTVELTRNDGFDTIEDFFAYFNEDYLGKIIHWTDLRYEEKLYI